jgi:hypothetical protein
MMLVREVFSLSEFDLECCRMSKKKRRIGFVVYWCLIG